MVAVMSRNWSIFTIWLFAYLLSYFYRSANAVIAADLRVDIGLNAEQLGFMTSVFYLSFALVQLPLGAALDRWGPRLVTPTMMLAGALGSALFALGESYAELILARALLGVGFASVLMGGLKAFAAWFPSSKFATVSSLLVGIGSSGALLAGTPLAWLSGLVGWRAIFAWGAGVVIVAAVAIAIGVRNAPPGSERLSDETPSGGFGDIARDHRFWRIAFLNLASVGTLLAVQGLWGGPYLADVYGFDELQIGNLLVALGVGAIIGNLSSGWLADRFGRGVVVMIGASVFVACQALLALALPAMPVAVLYLAFGAFGSFFVALIAEARAIFPSHLTGRALTAVNFFGMAGAMGVQWLMGVLIENAGMGGYGAGAYRLAFLVTTSLGVVATLLYVPVARQNAAEARKRSARL